MENATKSPCFLQESTLPASYLQWGIGEASTDASCFLKDTADKRDLSNAALVLLSNHRRRFGEILRLSEIEIKGRDAWH